MEASAIHAPTFVGRRSRSGPLLRLRSDDQLVALFRMGYEDAFGAIHDRYRERLFAYTRQMLGGARSDAEDVLQDVFLRAYGALRQDDRPVTLRAWLYRVAHNRCIDHLRRPQPPASEVYDVSRTPLLDPSAETERREELRRLVSDMRRLPEQQRSALLMRELEGLSYTELADALGVSVPAVKSLLVRARMSLIEAGEARDAACAEIRDELSLAFDRGVRMSGRSRKHVRDCAGCRGYRTALRGVQTGLGALSPGHGALTAIAKLLGLGGAGSGAATFGGAAGVGGATGATGAAGVGGAASAAGVATAGGSIAGAGVLGGGALAAKLAAVVSAAAVVGTGAAVEIRNHGGAEPKPAAATAPAQERAERARSEARSARARATSPVIGPAVPGQRADPMTGGAIAGSVVAGMDLPFPKAIIVTPHAPAPPMTLGVPVVVTGGLLAPEEGAAASRPPAAGPAGAAAAGAPAAPSARTSTPAAPAAPSASTSTGTKAKGPAGAASANASDEPSVTPNSTTTPATTTPDPAPAGDPAPAADPPMSVKSDPPASSVIDTPAAEPAPSPPAEPAPAGAADPVVAPEPVAP